MLTVLTGIMCCCVSTLHTLESMQMMNWYLFTYCHVQESPSWSPIWQCCWYPVSHSSSWSCPWVSMLARVLSRCLVAWLLWPRVLATECWWSPSLLLSTTTSSSPGPSTTPSPGSHLSYPGLTVAHQVSPVRTVSRWDFIICSEKYFK